MALGFRRRGRGLRARITEHPVGGAGVSLLTPDGKIAPRAMDDDGYLVDLGLGLAACALTSLEEPAAVALGLRLRRQAMVFASDGTPYPPPPEATPGSPAVEVRLRGTAVGPLATVRRARGSQVPLGLATPALLACAVEDRPDLGLGLGLAIEGLLAWFAAGDQSVRSPQQAVAYSLIHATERLEKAGRHVSVEVGAAQERHRLLTPHAGG